MQIKGLKYTIFGAQHFSLVGNLILYTNRTFMLQVYLDSFAAVLIDCLTWTSIFARILVAGTNLTMFLLLVNAFGN
jgi:hypothetical protein